MKWEDRTQMGVDRWGEMSWGSSYVACQDSLIACFAYHTAPGDIDRRADDRNGFNNVTYAAKTEGATLSRSTLNRFYLVSLPFIFLNSNEKR